MTNEIIYQKRIEELEARVEQLEKFEHIVRHGFAEKLAEDGLSVLFVCGQSGHLDSYGLPKHLLVCPAAGLDGFAIYTKTQDYSQPGY